MTDTYTREQDADLMRRFAAGDNEAAREFVELFRDKIASSVRGVIPIETDELVQRSIICLYSTASQYDNSLSSLTTWVCMIARRAAVDYVRFESARSHRGNGGLPKCRGFHIREQRRELIEYTAPVETSEQHAMIEHLSPKKYQIADMACRGTTMEGIATALGVPVGTVKSALFHIRKRFSGVAE